MSRKYLPVETNTFVKGLITEASPLTFPDNASIDEDNMVLLKTGARRRRLGFDTETDGTQITTTYVHDASSELRTSSFKWGNAGGDPDKFLEVVQTGNEMRVFDLDVKPLSDGLIYTYSFPVGSYDKVYSYTVVDGILVVAAGVKDVNIFRFDGVSTITQSTTNLLIRDFFGVEDIDSDGDNLKDGSNIEKRPTTLTEAHTYNLRNQTFSTPRYNGNTEVLVDPITAFYDDSDTTTPALPAAYPSNADNLISVLYADTTDAGGRTVDRFWPKDLIVNPLGSYEAPKGYFIIDALERGTSRLEQEAKLRTRHTTLSNAVTTLPTDKTPGGAGIVTEFAGRVFYAGFDGTVIDGDTRSPHMSSYILFSQLVNDISNIGKCYQEGDPTSKETPDLIATDGGFIRIDGAYNIHSMINVGTSLIITARNGVWKVNGGTDSVFSATNYLVEKITSHGSQGPESVVKVDHSVMYWGDDGIYAVSPNQYGEWQSTNISSGTIQTLYDNISSESKITAKGLFDSFELKVRWIYNQDVNDSSETKELIFDVSLKAFYTNTIKNFDGTGLPRVVSVFEVSPFQLVTNQFNVINGADQVINGSGNNVVATIGGRQSITKELGYLIINQTTPVVKFSFGSYNVTDFYDWKSIDGEGVDAKAYMVTGYLSGGDFQRTKNINYMSVHCRRSETGFTTESGEIVSTPQSSCLVQAQWEWTDSANSGKWGRQFQAYRHRRHYIPPSVDASFDDGYPVVTSRNKIRGYGPVVSFKFNTEPGKDFHLYGWSMIIGVNSNV